LSYFIILAVYQYLVVVINWIVLFKLIIIWRFVIYIIIIIYVILLLIILLIWKTWMLKYCLGIQVWSILWINLILKNFIDSLNKIGCFRNRISILCLIYLFIIFMISLLARKSLNYWLNILLLLLSKINTILKLILRRILVWYLLSIYICSCSQSWTCLYISYVALHLLLLLITKYFIETHLQIYRIILNLLNVI